MTSTVNGARTTLRRGRPTVADAKARRDAIYQIVRESQPTGVRFVYYRAVALGLTPKTQNGYRSIQNLVLDMRRDGTIPWGWIADATRWQYRPKTYSSIKESLAESAQTYRRTLWGNTTSVVEVWCESESIASVIKSVTWQWDVALFPCKGQPSDSFVYEAARQHASNVRPLTIYYLGDHDPAGMEIESNLEAKLATYSGRDDVKIVRLAVTPLQIDQFGLIGTNPKKTTWRDAVTGDLREWVGDAYEVEALDAPYLRDLVERCIRSHLSEREVQLQMRLEDHDRDSYLDILDLAS